MFSQAMKKWVQGNTDEVCPLLCCPCDLLCGVDYGSGVLKFLILAVSLRIFLMLQQELSDSVC